MSGINGCGCLGGNGAYPVCHDATSQETVASWLNNLTTNLFGAVTKTYSATGAVVWTVGCNPFNGGISNFPINQGEGYLCYIMRVMSNLGWLFTGTYNGALAYGQQNVVIYGNSLYISSQPVPAGTFPTNAAFWTLLMTAPPGPPGPAGPSSTPARTVRLTTVSTAAGNTDDLIYCTPAGAITVTLAAYGSYTAGKYFTIENNSAFNVTVATTGSDTILTGSGSSVSSVVVPSYSSLTVCSMNTGVWVIT
jgi:hypothetical protein